MKTDDILDLKKESALEWFMVTQLNQPRDRAKMIGAAMQIFVMVMLLFAIGVFLEWRLITFESLGCPAYCNCTERLYGGAYSLGDNNPNENVGCIAEDDPIIDMMVDRLEECDDGWDKCNNALLDCRVELNNRW